MNEYIATLENGNTITVKAATEASAKQNVEQVMELNSWDYKIDSINKLTPPKPDNSSVKEDAGFNFTAWNIHVNAKTEAEAKKIVKANYGINVDKDTPPANQS